MQGKNWFAGWLMACGCSQAGEVAIVGVQASRSGEGYRFDVTLRHADTGWEHYADRWEILTPDGEVLGTRVLYHPHVDEQPFTRSLSGIKIPEGVVKVKIRAHDSVHGYNAKERDREVILDRAD